MFSYRFYYGRLSELANVGDFIVLNYIRFAGDSSVVMSFAYALSEF